MKLVLILLLTVLPVLAVADIAEDIQKGLSPFEILRGNFQQTKTITIIKKPLKSSGNFVLLKGKGVLWNTVRPIAGTLKVTHDGITQIKDGQIRFQLKAEEQPALRLVDKVLFAVFSADLVELKQEFDLHGTLEAGHWDVRLIPKESWVSKVAKEIRLQGAATLDSLEISEANGDQTTIHFSGVDLDSKLTPAEKALFE